MQINTGNINVNHEPGADLFSQAVFGTNASAEIELPDNLDEPILDFDSIETHYNAGESANNMAFNRVINELNRLNKLKVISRAIASESEDLIPEAFAKRPINTYSITESKTNLKFASEALGLKGWALIALGLSATTIIIMKILDYFGLVTFGGGGSGGGGGGGGDHDMPKKAAEKVEECTAYVSTCRTIFNNAKIDEKYATDSATFKITTDILKKVYSDDDKRNKFTDALSKTGIHNDTVYPVNWDLYISIFVAVAAAEVEPIYIEEVVTVDDEIIKGYNIGTGNCICSDESFFVDTSDKIVKLGDDIFSANAVSAIQEFNSNLASLTNENAGTDKTAFIAKTAGLIKAALENANIAKITSFLESSDFKKELEAINRKFKPEKNFVLDKNKLSRIFDVITENNDSRLSGQFMQLFHNNDKRITDIGKIGGRLKDIETTKTELAKNIEKLHVKLNDTNTPETVSLIQQFKAYSDKITAGIKGLMLPIRLFHSIMGALVTYMTYFKRAADRTITVLNEIYTHANDGKTVSGNTIKSADIKDILKNKNSSDNLFTAR